MENTVDMSLPSLPGDVIEEVAQSQEKSAAETSTSPPKAVSQAVVEAVTHPVPAAVVAPAPAPPPPRVVVAPVCHGRSFLLRQSYDQTGRIGQMLVLLDKQQRHAPMEVVHAFLPLDRNRTIGRKTDRFYMGNRQIRKRYLALVMEVRIPVSASAPMTYRLLYPSGKAFREWTPFDLATLRLKTTEEQRVMISAFTGILYTLQEGTSREERRKQFSRQALGNAFQQAGVDPEALKAKLKP